GDELVERLAGDELRRDEETAVAAAAEVDDARQVRVLRALELLELALRALERRERGQDGRRDDLVGDVGVRLRVSRHPDLAAAAAAELRGELEARRRLRGHRVETSRPLGRRAGLLRTKVGVVGVLALAVRADFHPAPRVMTRL